MGPKPLRVGGVKGVTSEVHGPREMEGLKGAVPCCNFEAYPLLRMFIQVSRGGFLVHAFQPIIFFGQAPDPFSLGFRIISRKKDPWKEWGRYPQNFGKHPAAMWPHLPPLVEEPPLFGRGKPNKQIVGKRPQRVLSVARTRSVTLLGELGSFQPSGSLDLFSCFSVLGSRVSM